MSALGEIINLLPAIDSPPWYKNSLERFAEEHASADDMEGIVKQSRQYVEWLSEMTEVDVARLARADVILLDSPLPDAQAVSFNGENYILLHRGFLNLVSFSADAVVLIDVCHDIEPHVTIKDLAPHCLARWPTVNMVAGLASALTYAYFTQPVQLPVLHTRNLGPREQSIVARLTSCAELFAVMHEAAHIQLGHLSAGRARGPVRGEFLLPEPSSLEKEQELEADAHAFAALDRSARRQMAWGAFHYLRIRGTSEFIAPSSQATAHPLAINRAHAILDAFAPDFDDSTRRMAESAIEFLQQDYEDFGHDVEDPETGEPWTMQDKLRSLASGLTPERASWVLLRMGLFAKQFAEARAGRS
jgi:hypothetical protein